MSARGVNPRTYDNSRRAEQARATRRRIVDVARELLLTQGYATTTIAQVAKAAGVSSETVQKGFGTKAALAKAVYDVTLVGDDEPVPLLDRPWVAEIQREPDPRRIIALWLANGRQVLHRVAPLMRVMRGATGTDPELAAQWETNQQQTRTANGMLAQLLAARDALRPGLDVEQARDIAFTLSNAET